MQHPKPQHLMLPGPTPLPPAVLQAMATPLLNHRGEVWQELYKEVAAGVHWLCQTEHETVMLAGSGTTGMEAALCNLFSPGEQVLAICQGSFSERFAQMAEAFGLKVTRLSYAWGEAARPEDLSRLLAESGPFKALLLVHNETSTGVLNPLESLAKIARQHGLLTIVDAISSLTTTPLPVDAWGLDVVITASQKGYLAPPGLSMLNLSPAAWTACEHSTLPRYTLDLLLARDYARRAMTPWTPPMPVFQALKAGFELLRHEGLLQVQARHYRLMRAVRAGLQSLGMKLLVEDERIASRAVTPVYPPDGVAAEDIRKVMHNNYHITLGAGQRKLSGQIFRVGHLGYQDVPTVLGVLGCLEMTLEQLGYPVQPGTATGAAQEALRLS